MLQCTQVQETGGAAIGKGCAMFEMPTFTSSGVLESWLESITEEERLAPWETQEARDL